MAQQLTNPAKKQNEKIIKGREKQATSASGVFAPCLRAYQARIPKTLPTNPAQLAHLLLNNLTGPLWQSYPKTLQSIRKRMEQKWKGRPSEEFAAKVASSVANSKKRSAGTNFQSLVCYALALYLHHTDSPWYIHFPVPKEFTESLAITFTGGIPPQPQEAESKLPPDEEKAVEEVAAVEPPDEDAEEPEKTETALAKVNPDVDILLRNANWKPVQGKREPIVLLSVKTSIIDRGGSAARWKMYFDLANDPCPHICEQGCAYAKLGIQMENADKYDIRHGIVTANIYSMGNKDLDYRSVGELNNQQTRSNTYMFNLKLTTRDDEQVHTPADWKQFEHLIEFLAAISSEFGFGAKYTPPASSDASTATPPRKK